MFSNWRRSSAAQPALVTLQIMWNASAEREAKSDNRADVERVQSHGLGRSVAARRTADGQQREEDADAEHAARQHRAGRLAELNVVAFEDAPEFKVRSDAHCSPRSGFR